MSTAQTEVEESRNNDPNEREATELRDHDDAANSLPISSATTAMDDEATGSNVEPRPRERKSAADMIRTFWQRQVVVTVAHEACRDHFGTYCANDPRISSSEE